MSYLDFNMDAITEQMIHEYAKVDDLDLALRPLMRDAGIVTGDVAGQVFSNVAENSILNADNWPRLTHTQRVTAIRYWIATERMYATDGEPPAEGWGFPAESELYLPKPTAPVIGA